MTETVYIIRKPAKKCVSCLNCFTDVSVPHEVRTVKGAVLD